MKPGQKIIKHFKIRKLINSLRIVPLANIFLAPTFNRRTYFNFFFFFFVVIPTFGYFRRNYVKRKFKNILDKQQQTKQIELKQSLNRFDITIPAQQDYMVIIKCSANEELSKQDEEKARKIFQFQNQVLSSLQKDTIKYIFIGNKEVFQAVSREKQVFQFHENKDAKNQSKIILLARDIDDNQKVIMEWQLGAPLSIIQKHIAKHKYKKYLSSISF